MTTELRPLGVRCNLRCHYCYQHAVRENDLDPQPAYELAKLKEALKRAGGPFTVFGGEPLLVPTTDLEALWAWGLTEFGSNAIQTNGSLVTDVHLELFRRYRVQVGISIDGPGELNDVRSAGTLASTRAATRRTEATIERLCAGGTPPSLIVTLHRGNADRDRLPTLLGWLSSLDRRGVKSVRLHLLESETEAVRAALGLSAAENLAALRALDSLQARGQGMRFDLFDEMRRLLLGQDERVTCVWNGCDPYTTRAVQGIEGNGQRSNCGRTNKDGVEFLKASQEGFERCVALHGTSQQHGGCRGCRFFLACKGQCPGTAIDGDWRNRSEHCAVWQALFEQFERDLLRQGLQPISVMPERTTLERHALAAWSSGARVSLAGLVAALRPVDGPSWREELRSIRESFSRARRASRDVA